MIKNILLFTFIFSHALASLPPTTLKGQSESGKTTTFNFEAPYNQATTTAASTRLVETGNKNLLLNASFEHTTPTTSWTAGTGVTAAVETTEVKDGKKALTLTLSSTNGDVYCQNVTPTIKLLGSNMEHGIRVKTSLTTLQVCAQNAGATVATCADVLSDNISRYYYVNAPGPSSGSVGVCLRSTSSTSGAVTIDDAYTGYARNLSNVVPPNTFSAKVSETGVITDQVPYNWLSSCSNAAPSVCNYVTGIFTNVPNCNINGDLSGTLTPIPVINGTTGAGVILRTNDASGVAKASKYVVTCTKTGSDYVQPAITPDQTDRPYTPYTPVLSTGALATGGNQKYWYMLDGPNMIMYFEYEPGANIGTAGSGAYLITVPGGYSISSTITSGTGNATNFGFVYFLKSTNNGDARAAQITLVNSTQLAIRILNPTTDTYETWNNTTAPLNTANMRIGFIATIPIAGRENIRSTGSPILLGSVSTLNNFATRTGSVTIQCYAAGSVVLRDRLGVTVANPVDNGTNRSCVVTYTKPWADFPDCSVTYAGIGDMKPVGLRQGVSTLSQSTIVGPDEDFIAILKCEGPM